MAWEWGTAGVLTTHQRVFPKVQGPTWEEEAAQNFGKTIGWMNHPSADEGQGDLETLITEAQEKGFISVYDNNGGSL